MNRRKALVLVLFMLTIGVGISAIYVGYLLRNRSEVTPGAIEASVNGEVTILCGYDNGSNKVPFGDVTSPESSCAATCTSLNKTSASYCSDKDLGDIDSYLDVFGCIGKTNGTACDSSRNDVTFLKNINDGSSYSFDSAISEFPGYCTYQIDFFQDDGTGRNNTDFIIFQVEDCDTVITPPVTTPPVTTPPVTTPPVTTPPVTTPPVTTPPVTTPPVTTPPVTTPPITTPPVTEPPVTEPPVTEPPVTNPPVTQPPATPVIPCGQVCEPNGPQCAPGNTCVDVNPDDKVIEYRCVMNTCNQVPGGTNQCENYCELPDTALVTDEADRVIIAILLILVGTLIYKSGAYINIGDKFWKTIGIRTLPSVSTRFAKEKQKTYEEEVEKTYEKDK